MLKIRVQHTLTSMIQAERTATSNNLLPHNRLLKPGWAAQSVNAHPAVNAIGTCRPRIIAPHIATQQVEIESAAFFGALALPVSTSTPSGDGSEGSPVETVTGGLDVDGVSGWSPRPAGG
jgi:hypothetical protein